MKPRFLSVLVAVVGLAISSPVPAATLSTGDFVMVTWNSDNSPCCRVLSLDPTSLAVSEISSNGYIADPTDIAVNGQGKIFVTVPSVGIVQVEPATGVQTIFASVGSMGGGTASGVCIGDGEIYVTLRGPARVAQLNTDGSFARVVSSGGMLSYPAGLALGPDGALYVCETIPTGASPGGGLIRVDKGSGAQAIIATNEPLHGPFEATFAPDGWLWSIQHNYHLHEIRGAIVRTRVSDGFCEPVATVWSYVSGIAIRADGLTLISDCVPISGDCRMASTQVYPDGPSTPWLGGPMAVVPDLATPATKTSWGRLKVIYR